MASMWQKRIDAEKAAAAVDVEAEVKKVPRKRRSIKIGDMASLWEKKPESPKKPPVVRKRRSGSLTKKWSPATESVADGDETAAESDRPQRGSGKVGKLAAGLFINPAALKPKPPASGRPLRGTGKVGKLAMGLAINPAALKPGASGPPRKKKVHALAMGLKIPMGALRPGSRPSLKKVKSATELRELSNEAQLAKPTIPVEKRRRRGSSSLSVSLVSEGMLSEYLKKRFEVKRTVILPEAELLEHLKRVGFDLTKFTKGGKRIRPEHDAYDLTQWHLAELNILISVVFGEVRHRWGFHLCALPAH